MIKQISTPVHGSRDRKCLKNLDFIKKTNRLQNVKFEISYVNMCGVSYGERRIFATKLVIFA